MAKIKTNVSVESIQFSSMIPEVILYKNRNSQRKDRVSSVIHVREKTEITLILIKNEQKCIYDDPNTLI